MHLNELLKERIFVLDGAMGSLIQEKSPAEADYRGDNLKDHPINLKGNHELLNINCPNLIYDVHSSYLKAGADIITTNTFNANSLSQKDYKTEHMCYSMNLEACQIAQKAAKAHYSPNKPRFVAGCIGPTSKSLSMSLLAKSSDTESISFDMLAKAYSEQINGLIDGGADILMIETIFDTLNSKAAIYAISKILQERSQYIPVMISATIAGEAGRLLSGQNIPAFYHSVKHANPLSVGLNCSFGASKLKPFVEKLSEEASCFVSFHPNAGIPDADGNYSQSADQMAKDIESVLQDIDINIIGGCCGTTPQHVEAYNDLVSKYGPAKFTKKQSTVLSGLEPLKVNDNNNLLYIGEKTNVAGSQNFAKLIKSDNYQAALNIASQQIEEGAQILDVCMDTAGVDSESAIKEFLTQLNANPQLAKIPIMVDSSNFQTIQTALKCIQGKPIVNSISLKNGEQDFIDKAVEIKNLGASVVVMLFDEKGQADSTERRKEIADRSYKLLTEKAKYPVEDIIFDPTLMAIGIEINGMENQAVSFLKACKYIKTQYPKTNIVGGISNLSYSFRGAGKPRKAIHKVFLKEAQEAGLKFAIINPGEINNNNFSEKLISLAKSAIFDKDSSAVDDLMKYATKKSNKKSTESKSTWRELDLDKRLEYALINGIDDYLKSDIESIINNFEAPYKIIDEILMPAMEEISKRYDEGSLFLPQVIRGATVFQKAVDFIQPYLKNQNNESHGEKRKVVIATVEGDVHDIGKNIATVVFECNGYEVIDLGVMVPAQKIVETVKEKNAELVGLSGLITPSLQEMAHVAELLEKEKLCMPLLIGGATTSEKHTNQRIAPKYSGSVIHVKDASKIGAILQKQKA